MTLLDPQSEWARLVMSSFSAAGVRDLVLSPGSRSTPFALAAANDPRLRIHTIIDERAAAFFALGQARVTGVPSLLLCTSGSAPAHYLPAVVEARHAHVPLLILTADRPLEAMHAGAPQTIDQTRLFGEQARAFFELGGMDAAPSALRGLRRTIAQACAFSRDGAVHLNVRARKPLEPQPASELEREVSSRIVAVAAQPLPRFHISSNAAPAVGALDGLRARIVEEDRGVIAVGPLIRPDEALSAALIALSKRSGYPLLVEPTSQLTAGLPGALSTIFAAEKTRAALQPRIVLQIGPPPVAASYERVVADAAHLEIFASTPDVDADSRARVVHVADLLALVLTLTAALPDMRPGELPRSEYGARVNRAAAAAARALNAALQPHDELAAIVEVMRAQRGVVLVGNSLPVREVALAAALGATHLAYHQRGASGIDGLCAGAAGIASTGRPTLLLLGDVSLLHDLHGMMLAGQSKTPLVAAVINNGGGRIFDQLPVGKRADLAASMPLFTTPVATDLALLARFCGARFSRIERAADVAAAVTTAFEHAGATLLELVVAPHSAAELAARLPAIVDEACA